MSNQMNDSDKEEKTQKINRQPPITQMAVQPNISTEVLGKLLTVSDSIKHIYNSINTDILSQAFKALEPINVTLLSEASKVLDTQRRLFESNNILSSATFDLASTVNQSIGRLLGADTVHINEIFKQSVFQTDYFKGHLQVTDRLAGSLSQYDLVWRSHLIDVSRFSTLSQTILSQISCTQMGDALNMQHVVNKRLQDTLLDFSKSYSGLFQSLQEQPSIMTMLPLVISKLPAVEFFNGVRVIDAITFTDKRDVELEEQKQQATEEVRRETGESLEVLLKGLNPEFIIPLQGARQSVDSNNPDHIRHFATSMRELFTQVLHTLAPDDKIKDWTQDPRYYENNRPIRRVRLLYICRLVNHPPFLKFVEKDIDTTLEFLQLFQQGTHEVISKYTDYQLRLMLVRMESTIRFLLEVPRAL